MAYGAMNSVLRGRYCLFLTDDTQYGFGFLILYQIYNHLQVIFSVLIFKIFKCNLHVNIFILIQNGIIFIRYAYIYHFLIFTY